MKALIETIELCRKGDKAAIARLLSLHKALISNVISRWVDDPVRAEDVLQNVFLCIIRSIRKFRFESDISTWIYAITQNECYRHLTRLKKDREQVPLESVEAVLEGRPEAGPDRAAQALEIREKLGAVIEGLDEEKKKVIALYYYSGLDTLEIAETLSIPANTVYTRLKRARDEIKRILREKGIDF